MSLNIQDQGSKDDEKLLQYNRHLFMKSSVTLTKFYVTFWSWLSSVICIASWESWQNLFLAAEAYITRSRSQPQLLTLQLSVFQSLSRLSIGSWNSTYCLGVRLCKVSSLWTTCFALVRTPEEISTLRSCQKDEKTLTKVNKKRLN